MTPVSANPARPRLLARLDESRLTVLWGPAGHGKSMLVEAWLTVHPDRRAIRAPAPEAGVAADRYWSETVRAVRADTDVLVLDRLDLLADPGTWERVHAVLADHPGLRVVMTVCDGGLLWPLRFPDPNLTVVTPGELQFTVAEVADLLAHRTVSSSDRTARDLWRITGGHPALVAVAVSVVLLFGSDLEFERDRAYEAVRVQIDAYVEQTLRAVPNLAATARTIAVLRRPSPGALAALGDEDPAATLVGLERAGLLRRMPAAPDQYWAWPAAVRRSLLRTAARGETGPTRAVSSTLARWFAASGDPVEALWHATDAQDWDLVVDTVTDKWMHIATTRLGVLSRALTALPDDRVRARPALYYARQLVTRLDPERQGVHRPVSDEAPPPAEIAEHHSVELALATGALRSTLLRWTGDYDGAVRDHEVLTALADRFDADGADERIAAALPALWMHLGLASEYRGDHRTAAALFGRAIDHGSHRVGDFAARQAAGQLALQHAVLGDTNRAAEWVEREAAFGDRAGWLGEMIRLPALAARTLVALDRLDLAAAEDALAALPEPRATTENWAFVLYVQSQADVAFGRPGVGLDRLDRYRTEFGRWMPRSAVARPLLDAAAMDLRTAAGDGARVLEAAQRSGEPMHPLVRVSAARAAMLSGDTALTLRHTAVLTGRATDVTRARLEALLIEATVEHEVGERDSAGQAWNRAVALMESSGLRRPLLVVPVEIRDALVGAGGSPVAVDHQGRGPFPRAEPPVTLTEREAAVLAGLVRGSNVAQIAESLFVSPNTVKSQLKSLYRKLGVHSRSDAVLEGARRGLC